MENRLGRTEKKSVGNTAGLYEVKISLEPVSTEFDGQEVVVEVGYLGLSSNSSK